MGSKSKPATTPYDANANAAVANLNTQTPLQLQHEQQTQNVLDFEAGTGQYAGKPRNILDAPGMDLASSAYGNANALANQEQMGTGALALSNTAGGAYGSQLKELGANQRYQQRAEGLSGAYHDLIRNAHNEASGIINTDLSQRGAYANALLGQQSSYLNRPKTPSIWSQILGGAAAGAAGAI